MPNLVLHFSILPNISLKKDLFNQVWNRALARLALNIASACELEHSNDADTAGTGGFRDIGENIYAGTRQIREGQLVDVASRAVQKWGEEGLDFIYPNCQRGKSCGHYTQVLLAFDLLIIEKKAWLGAFTFMFHIHQMMINMIITITNRFITKTLSINQTDLLNNR